MFDYAAEILDAVSWTGPAMVEFMETPAGEFQLIEVNGRYWGSLPFAIRSGVDVPWLHYRQLRGLPVEPPASYRTDRMQQRLVYGDIKWLLEQLRSGNPLAPVAVLWSALVADVTFVSLRDPMPTLETFRQMAALGGSTAAGRLAEMAAGGRMRESAPRGETR
jgi:predicted ATP-grasp superfamily ATP-dependent carboligase